MLTFSEDGGGAEPVTAGVFSGSGLKRKQRDGNRTPAVRLMVCLHDKMRNDGLAPVGRYGDPIVSIKSNKRPKPGRPTEEVEE